MKLLFAALISTLSFSSLASKLGEDSSPAVQDCKTVEHCTKCLKARGCDLAISNNMVKAPASSSGKGQSRGGKKEALNQ